MMRTYWPDVMVTRWMEVSGLDLMLTDYLWYIGDSTIRIKSPGPSQQSLFEHAYVKFEKCR
jgi:hypothetical protein